MTQVKTFPVRQIDPRRLIPNGFNPNHVDPVNLEKLQNSINKLGFFDPLKVRELPDGSLQIIGGEHRAKVAVVLGMTEVPCVMLGQISEREAREIMLADNARYGQEDHDELMSVLRDIGTPDEIMALLPFEESELANFFAHETGDFDDLDSLDDLDDAPVDLSKALSKPTKTHQILRFKVALEDADKLTDLLFKVQQEQGFTGSDQLTNAGDALLWLLNQTK